MEIEHIQTEYLSGDLEHDTDLCKSNWITKIRNLGYRPDAGDHVTYRMDDGNMRTVGRVVPIEPDNISWRYQA